MMRPLIIVLLIVSFYKDACSQHVVYSADLFKRSTCGFELSNIFRSSAARTIIDSLAYVISKSSIGGQLNGRLPLTDCNEIYVQTINRHREKVKSGNGIYISKRFSVYQGTFENNILINGRVIEYTENCDSLYIGTIRHKQRTGEGYLLLKSGAWQEGLFENSKLINGRQYYFEIQTGNWQQTKVLPPKSAGTDTMTKEKPATKPKNLSRTSMHAPRTNCTALQLVIDSNNLWPVINGYFDRIAVKVKNDYEAKRLNVNTLESDFYSGSFKVKNGDTLYHGNGILISKNKSYYSGSFVNGRFSSGWKYEEKDSCEFIYIGQVMNFKNHGTGLLINKNGTWYYGLFDKGKFNKGEACDYNSKTGLLTYGKYIGGFFWPRP